jgi:DNA replication protein DnaC
MQVRTGKTLTAMATAHKFGAKSVLFVTKKKAIIDIVNQFSGSGIEMGIYVTNYEQLANVHESFDLIIIDEAHSCFIGDTLIDGKKIKDINLRDSLKTFNFTKGVYEYKNVVNIYKNKLSERLVKIKCNGKEIVCTESHEIYTKRGWVKAIDITTSDELQVL